MSKADIGTIISVIVITAGAVTVFYTQVIPLKEKTAILEVFHDNQGDTSLLTMIKELDKLQIDIAKLKEMEEEWSQRPTGVQPPNLGPDIAHHGYAVTLGATSGTTSCGMQFDAESKYAAHYNLPCGTEVTVTSLASSITSRLRVQERAGSSTAWINIVLALSPEAADELGISGRGPVIFAVEGIP